MGKHSSKSKRAQKKAIKKHHGRKGQQQLKKLTKRQRPKKEKVHKFLQRKVGERVGQRSTILAADASDDENVDAEKKSGLQVPEDDSLKKKKKRKSVEGTEATESGETSTKKTKNNAIAEAKKKKKVAKRTADESSGSPERPPTQKNSTKRQISPPILKKDSSPRNKDNRVRFQLQPERQIYVVGSKIESPKNLKPEIEDVEVEDSSEEENDEMSISDDEEEEEDEDDETEEEEGEEDVLEEEEQNNNPLVAGAQNALQVQFGTKLSHSEKSVRDNGFKALQKWLKKKAENLSTLEFLKLWESLFYCLWMSDKKPVQQELSVQIAKLTGCIPKEKLADWVGAFFEVHVNRWKYLDVWRMNKFLLMVRIQIAETFAVLAKDHAWDEDIVEALNETMLSYAPLCVDGHFNPGFTMHAISCFWDELKPLMATKAPVSSEGKSPEKKKKKKGSKKTGDVPAAEEATSTNDETVSISYKPPSRETVMHLLEPYFQVLADSSFPEPVHRAVARDILTCPGKLPEEFREEVAEELFDISRDDQIKIAERKRLMTIVDQLQKKKDTVTLPERRIKLNPKLRAPKKMLRKGLGVRTRNQRKTRQRDKR